MEQNTAIFKFATVRYCFKHVDVKIIATQNIMLIDTPIKLM